MNMKKMKKQNHYIRKSRIGAIHQNAVRRHNRSMHLTAVLHGALAAPYFRSPRLHHVQEFEPLPEYRELFGNLDLCECGECKSIFGPAAYFVDLMRIHRLQRLAKSLRWDFETTDWCLRVVKGTTGQSNGDATIPDDHLAKEFDLQPIETSALFRPIKTCGSDGFGPVPL